MYKKNNLLSIIVIYKPDLNKLSNIINKHLIQFKKIILINNSPDVSLSNFKNKSIVVYNNEENIGVAKAINIGINYAKKNGFSIASLFDQDTILPNFFVNKMLRYINIYNNKYETGAIFSPIFFNLTTGNYNRPHCLRTFGLGRIRFTPKHTFINPQYVITSGSFIPISVLDDVGLMREELFIDFVDIEWCLRARAKGYEIVSFPQVEIEHHLGDSSVSFMGTNYPIHSPLRMYYYFRNAMYLYRLREIDWNWRLVDATRNLFRFLFYMLFVKNRPTYFKYIIKGYYHGLMKKMGKLEE